MSKKNLLCVMLLATGFLVNTPSMAMQSESPVICVDPEPLQLVYGDHVPSCEVNPATDLDTFTFDGTAGDEIRIIVLSETNALDPRIELRDPVGTVIRDSSCSGGSGSFPTKCSFRINETLVLTGTYFIALSDVGNNETGFYTMQLERIPPVPSPPNLQYNAFMDDGLAPPTDLDFFEFEGAAGTDVRITVLSKTFALDPRLEVRDPDGTVVIDTSCSGGSGSFPTKCSFSEDLSLSLSGTYVITMSDSGSNESGDYQIGLQCLFGPCPAFTVTRPECDIQMSQASYVDGDTVTADVFRYTNLTTAPIAVEWKVWLGVPGIPPIGVINLGANGSFVLPPGTDIDLGPIPLLPAAALPVGEHEFSCRFLNPTTGRLLMEDRNFFDRQ